MSKTAWIFVSTLLLPPWAFLCLLCYWYFFDNSIPLIITYSHPTFVSRPATDKTEAFLYGITSAKPGQYVWTYRELCINEKYTEGTLKQSWDGASFSWTLPDTKFTSTPGCKSVSYAVETPKLSFTKNIVYNSVREYELNPLKNIGIVAPGIPLTIVYGNEPNNKH